MKNRDQSEDRAQSRYIVFGQETPAGLRFGVQLRTGAIVIPAQLSSGGAVKSSLIFDRMAQQNAARKASMLSA